MTLASRTFKKQVENIIRNYYVLGRIPSPTELESALQHMLTEYPPGKPRLKLRPQKRNERFDINKFNIQTQEIEDDLQILYDALLGIVEDMNKQVSINQSITHTLDRQLNTLDDDLEDLIITSKTASSYLYSVSEYFNKLDQIDVDNTTADVDLANRNCTLRKLQKGTRKLSMMHMVASTATDPHPRPDIQVMSGDNVALRQETPMAYALSSFGDQAFMLIYSADNGPVRIAVEFRVAPESTPAVNMSRMDLDPVGEFDLRVLYTNENRASTSNWLLFPGLENKQRIVGRSSFNFESRPVSYLRLEMEKDSPDREKQVDGDILRLFQFGMKSLELFSQGYASQSTLQTKALEPQGSEFLDSVGKVSLEIQEKPRPAGTDVKYSVKLDDDDAPWVPISPVNRPGTRNGSKVVDFGGSILSPRRDNYFRVTSPSVYENRYAINFYNLKTLDNTPVFGSARLYPGLGGWKQGGDTQEILRSVSNNYLVFTSSDDKQHLYLTAKNEEARDRAIGGSVYLELAHDILQQDGMPLIPPAGGGVNQNPLYSIERILKVKGVSPTSGSSGSIVRIPGQSPELRLNEVLASPSSYVNQFVYIDDGTNTSYVKIQGQYTDASSNTVLVLGDVGSLFGSSVSWRLDIQDVTSNVDSIENTRTVKTDLATEEGARYLISYRYALTSDQEIVDGSVRVRLPASDEILRVGRDFAIDTVDKSIQRLSDKINAGSGTTVSAIADFQIRETVTGPTIYTTYVDVSNRIQINLSSITIDRQAGEFFRIIPVSNSGVSSVNSASSGGIVTLEGTMSFVVGSKKLFRPDGSINTDSALYKVINLTDTSGNNIFDPNRYFDRMYAIPEPMEQTTITKLRARSPEDYSAFAIVDDKIITNHNPVDRDDILVVLPGQTAKQSYVDFDVGYQYVPSDIAGIKKVKLRAELVRDRDTDGSVTPVIEGFILRFS